MIFYRLSLLSILCVCITVSSTNSWAISINNKTPEEKTEKRVMSQKDYLSQYGYFAVISMHKYNIPASIIIAQGMLESAYGNSSFSKISNNHFGIKCGEQWKGNSITHQDDSPEECFRSYSSVYASFEDHGKFLKSRIWYNSLFMLDPTDYKSWARGLQQAGYATDPRYAEKLIDIIERYNLSQLDEMPLI